MEILDIYDDNGMVTDKTIVRGDKSVKLSPNEHIALSVVFIENSKGEFLIQKTSEEKGSVFSTTGGHVDSGETPIEAIKREVFEELGVNIENDNIVDLGYMLFDMPIRYIYYLKKDVNIDDVIVQKEEVDYVLYLTVDKIKKLIDSGEMLKSHGILFNEMLDRLNSSKLYKNKIK